TRSVTIFPGSCTARGARHRASPSVRPRPTPVTRAVSASTTVPASDTRPLPSADTAILARRAILFTLKVPLLGADRTFSKPYPPRPKALSTHTTRRRSHSAESPRLAHPVAIVTAVVRRGRRLTVRLTRMCWWLSRLRRTPRPGWSGPTGAVPARGDGP